MNKVAVFGSLNMDIIVDINEFPKPGETIQANSIDYKAGGKGLNQAAAAAAAGASTILIGTVGQDSFGQELIGQADKIPSLDGSRIRNTDKEPTGIASIQSTQSDNTIEIITGANALTDKKMAQENRQIFEEADVLITQFETPEEGVREALKAAKFGNTITILCPAPYHTFGKDLLEAVSVITPNETEFAGMVKDFDIKEDTLEKQILAWQKLYPDTRIVVTRGDKGLSYVEGGNIVTLSALKVKAVDATGAGDTFTGVLAALLSKNMPWEEAVYKSAVAAGLSVQHKGALGSAPKMEEIDLYISENQMDANTQS